MIVVNLWASNVRFEESRTIQKVSRRKAQSHQCKLRRVLTKALTSAPSQERVRRHTVLSVRILAHFVRELREAHDVAEDVSRHWHEDRTCVGKRRCQRQIEGRQGARRTRPKK